MSEHKIYVPNISTAPVPDTDENPVFEGIAKDFFRYMQRDPRQGRAGMVRDDLLDEVAQARAEDMVHRDYHSHVDPDGIGPNQWVESFGYSLPDWYSSKRHANSIESIINYVKDASNAWDHFMASEDHIVHLLGLTKFFAEQTNVGIGVEKEKDFDLYRMVIITAPVEEEE